MSKKCSNIDCAHLSVAHSTVDWDTWNELLPQFWGKTTKSHKEII